MNNKKEIEFVVCSNLVNLNQEMLDFIKTENIQLSTSLDGPQKIHDYCRKLRNGRGSYRIVHENILKSIQYLGKGSVGALLTVTPYNLKHLKNIIDEYLACGLNSVFLRPLNPFGRAKNNKNKINYKVFDFINQYKNALDYIIEINRKQHFQEIYSSILLAKILSPFSIGFVDLQSPAGTGISGVIYDTTGDVFVSDEARMQYYTDGDKRFCIGNVNENTWNQIFENDVLKQLIHESCLECKTPCAWCAFLPFCGVDPVRNYYQYSTLSPNMAKTETCIRHKAMFKYLIHIIESDSQKADVLWSWITGRNLSDIHKPTEIKGK
jgi:His-Xaa-Ser system radical SAM maturase HxsB